MDIEKAVIGALQSPEDIKTALEEGLNPELFSDPFHAGVVEFTIGYYKGSLKAPTPAVLEEQFGQPVEVESSSDSLVWLMDRLKTNHKSGELQDILRDGAAGAFEDPDATVGELYRRLWELRQNVSSHRNRVDLSENIIDRREAYHQRIAVRGQAAPIGFEEVDSFTGGIRPGEIVTVAGYAKQGKSWTLVNAAVEAKKQGYTPYVASLELDVDTFSERIDAVFSGIGYGKMSRGALLPNDLDRLHEAQEELADLGPFYVENPVPEERTSDHLVSRARQLGCDYIIVDQLSWIRPTRNHQNRRDAYLEVLETLKLSAGSTMEGPLPVLLAVQFNREAGPKGRGSMENMANAADIEQITDMMFGLYRTDEMRADDAIVLDMLGSRRSDLRSWLLHWELDSRTDLHVRGPYMEGGDS